MKLAIFGASGRTGRPLVQQALDAGHSVNALVRTPATFPMQHERLTVVQGDAMDLDAVEKVVRGTDAVLSVLGQTKGSPKDIQTMATKNIIAVMQKYEIRRFVSLTGAGVDAPEDSPKLINHVIKFALKTMAGAVLKDAEQHAAVLRGSTIDWTIVRGPMLTEGPYTGKYRVGWVGVNTGTRVSRADIADFMLKQLDDTTYLRKAPMISD